MNSVRSTSNTVLSSDSNAINAPNALNERIKFQAVLIDVYAFHFSNSEIAFRSVSAFRIPKFELYY
jgi:hypothetical protein